jgi:hypothetical protein
MKCYPVRVELDGRWAGAKANKPLPQGEWGMITRGIYRIFLNMNSVRKIACLLSLLVGMVSLTPAAQGEIELFAQGQLPGNSTDESGLTEMLRVGNERIPHNRMGGFSAIAYTGKEDLYWVLPDRGPLDGAADYACRVQLIKISQPEAGQKLQIQLVATHLQKTENGEQLIGSAKAFDLAAPEKSLRFDCEGLRTGRSGHMYLSDEYGPHIYEFSTNGIRQRSIPLPEKLMIQTPSADPLRERAGNRTGRLPNGGMEGLAIAPDGSTLFGMMQNPLSQDQGENGRFLRLIAVPIGTGPQREYAYKMEAPGLGISEILAVNDHEFLCIERDGASGTAATMKKIMKARLTSGKTKFTTDISDVAELPDKHLPDSIHPMKKFEFINLLDPKFGLAGASFPKKVEGLTFGPRLGGKISLIVCTDNDFQAMQPSRFFWFTLDQSDLPDFQPQQFD